MESRANNVTVLQTRRLILRPWEERDAEILFRYAGDPDVGPAAGWPAHRDKEESLRVIRDILRVPETYAVCLKARDGEPVGSVGLHMKDASDLTDRDDECELGYWLGKPFWGQGLIPEAAREMLRHAFEDLGMNRVWCGYFDGNLKSKRVQEKLGFRYQRTNKSAAVPQMGETREDHVSALTKDDWIRDRIRHVDGDRTRFLPLLLLADEQEDMVARYLDRGELYVAEDDAGEARAECLLTDEGNGVAEIKSLAVVPEAQGKGYGKAMIGFAADLCRGRFDVLQVGTGDSPLTVPFYERCGFVRHHTDSDFFTRNYDHPIVEAGVTLRDMVFLRMPLDKGESEAGSL